MTTELIKEAMDAFYEAKRVRDLLPALPDGIHSSYINTLDVVHQLSEKGKPVRVSDVADRLRLPRPAVTRTVKAIESRGLIRKERDRDDGRVFNLFLTPEGERIYHIYVEEYFDTLKEKLTGISDESAEEMIRTIHRIREALQ